MPALPWRATADHARGSRTVRVTRSGTSVAPRPAGLPITARGSSTSATPSTTPRTRRIAASSRVRRRPPPSCRFVARGAIGSFGGTPGASFTGSPPLRRPPQPSRGAARTSPPCARAAPPARRCRRTRELGRAPGQGPPDPRRVERAADAVDTGSEDRMALSIEKREAEGKSGAGGAALELVGEVHLEERRDVVLLREPHRVVLAPAPVDHVGVVLVPRGVGDVEHLGHERAGPVEAPVRGERVEAPAPGPQARAEGHPSVGTEPELLRLDELAHGGCERYRRIAQEVAPADLRGGAPVDGEEPRHAPGLAEPVEVEERHRDPLGERVARRGPAVPDGPLVDRVGRRRQAHGRPAPSARATRRPLAAPSSWNPYPHQAPQNQVALRPFTSSQRSWRGEALPRVDRVVVLEPPVDLCRVDLVLAVEGDEDLLGGLQVLQPVHPVRDRREVARFRGLVVVPRGPGPPRSGQERGVGVEDRDVALVGDGAKDLALGVGRIAQQLEGLVAVDREDDAVESQRAAGREQLDARPVAPHLVDRRADLHVAPEAAQRRRDVLLRPPADGAPLGTVQHRQQAVVVHEGEQRTDREPAEGLGVRGPDRGSERQEVLVDEAGGEPVLREEVVERELEAARGPRHGPGRVAEDRPADPTEPGDLPEEGPEPGTGERLPGWARARPARCRRTRGRCAPRRR